MVRSVSEEPEVTILRWGIMWDPHGYRLVGFHAGTRRGRVTSPIVSFDEHAKLAVTESGRHYHLAGDPDPTAAAVLIREHMRRCGLTLRDVALADVEEIALALAPRPAQGRMH